MTSEYVSEIIFYNHVDVLKATLSIPSSSGSISLFLSNDDGTTWEAASNGIEHTFVTTGQKLKFRIVGQAGAVVNAPVKVNYITV